MEIIIPLNITESNKLKEIETMKYTRSVLTMCVILILLTGCMAGMQGVKSYSEMTPKEKAGFALSVYNNAAGEYLWQYQTRAKEDGSFSDNDRERLKKYWDALNKAWKPIKIYDTYISAGTLPTQEMEDELVAIIRTLSLLLEDK